MVKIIAKREGSERGRERGYRLVEALSKREGNERRRESMDGLVLLLSGLDQTELLERIGMPNFLSITLFLFYFFVLLC